jgi:hypothetical protein
MDSGSAASSAASDVSKSPLDYVLESEGFEVDVECTGYGQGGGGPDISIDEITILVILFHGTILLTKESTINVGNLSSINNLAYLALAPTGLSNVGTNHELDAHRRYIQYEIKKKIEESIVESLQKIETKADELVTKNASQPVSQPVSQSVKKIKNEVQAIGIFSKICTYCFHFLKKSESLLLQLRDLLTNYKFTNTFTVCKSVGAASLSGGNGLNLLKGGTKRGRIPIPPLSMSHDMFVLMLNESRLKIKKFDSERVTNLCTTQLQQLKSTTTPPPPGYRETLETTLKYIEERCRRLHVLKGLGLNESQPTRFVNKHLLYDSSPTDGGKSTEDANKNMGVIKLQFSIDSSGKVKCSDTPYDAHDVMKAIAYSKPPHEEHGGVYWGTMEACINHCTENDPNSGTTFVIDLTCSSVLGAECSLLEQSSDEMYISYPGGGGGKRIKKKSGSRKKTRRVKNKSRNTRYIRNRRNRLKHNKRTKKSRKTKTSRKH